MGKQKLQIRLASIAMILCLLTALLQPAVPKAFAGRIGTRFLRLSTSVGSVQATHLFGITYDSSVDEVGSVVFEYCMNDPLPGTPCTPPVGLNVSSANLSSQSGETGFSIDPASGGNVLILSRTAAVPSNMSSMYGISSVRNPDNPGSYYVRVYTYSSEDASGPVVDEGGLAFAITRAVSVSAEVPPYLLLCVGVQIVNFNCASATSFLINMGELSSSQTARGTSELVVATNAGYGYTVTITGTTLISGNNIVNAMAGAGPSIPGTRQFGVNLRSNSSPPVGAEPTGSGTGSPVNGYQIPNAFKFNNGDVVITSNTTSNYHKFTTSYIANIDASQPAGYYATTISYIALGNF